MSSTIVSPKQLGSGSPGSSNFLRGDGTWAVPSGSGYSAGSGLTLSGSVFSINDAYSNSWTSLQSFGSGINVTSGNVVITDTLYVNSMGTGSGPTSTGSIRLGDGTINKTYGTDFTFDSGGRFSSLVISGGPMAQAGDGTYTLSGYFNTNTGLAGETGTTGNALNPGVVVYYDSVSSWGVDLGYNPAVGRYRSRLFAQGDISLSITTIPNPTNQSHFIDWLVVTQQGNVGINTLVPTAAQLEVTSSSAETVGIIIDGVSGQTANLQEWLVSGSLMASVDARGGANFPGLSVVDGKILLLLNAENTFYSGFQDGGSTENILYQMPVTPPTAGQVLSAGAVSESNSQLSWVTPSASSYFAGSGLSLSGTTFSINEGYANSWTALQSFGSGLTLTGGKASLAASTSSGASANIATGTAPSSPATGDLWYDGTYLNYQDNVSGYSKRLNKDRAVLMVCAGFTPTATGGDVVEIPVPYHGDGTTSVTWNVRRISFRVQTAGGAPAMTIEVSTGSGAFSATTVGGITLSSGANEGSQTSGFTTSTVASGNKIRFNATSLATAQNWTITIELEEQ